MNIIKAYKIETVANDQGDWVDREVLDVELVDVIGYSFGTNTFQAMFPDSSIRVFPLTRFDRIDILTPAPEEVADEELTEEPASAEDTVH